MSVAFLFPGQGAQHVGMAQDLCRSHGEAAACFEQAEAITGLPLRRLCFEGPEDELARTDISQPAIFTMSMAVLRVVEAMRGEAVAADVVAGLSLGEYTALCAAGAISFETGVDLVARRGRYMQEAAEATDGGMLCLLGADEDVAEAVCRKASPAGRIQPANFNCPGQIVLSGETAACRKAAEAAQECGASGVVELKVAGAFHSPLMQPAADRLAEALAAADIRPPAVQVLSNVTGEPHDRDGDAIRRRLLEQLTHPVLWQRNCEYLLGAGVGTFLEMGPGRVLAGLMRRIDRRTRVTSLNDLASVEAYANG
ncbi:MAG: ACP S-malonyltransferase [Planctomycetes bacterium]|nr:ACP S-malonyltransferase [Planctomycetota bacterium]